MSIGAVTSSSSPSSGSSLQSIEQQIAVLEKKIDSTTDAKAKASDEASLETLEREENASSSSGTSASSTGATGKNVNTLA